RLPIALWIQFSETGFLLSLSSQRKSLVLNSNEALYILCPLVAGLHPICVGPAKRRLVRDCVGRVSLRKSRLGEDSLMQFTVKFLKFLAVFTLSIFLLPAATQAQHYTQTNLVSNIVGMAPITDPNLKNPWGLTRSSTTPVRAGTPWWVGNNNSGTSTLYTGAGAIIPINGTGTVTVPPPKAS